MIAWWIQVLVVCSATSCLPLLVSLHREFHLLPWISGECCIQRSGISQVLIPPWPRKCLHSFLVLSRVVFNNIIIPQTLYCETPEGELLLRRLWGKQIYIVHTDCHFKFAPGPRDSNLLGQIIIVNKFCASVLIFFTHLIIFWCLNFMVPSLLP